MIGFISLLALITLAPVGATLEETTMWQESTTWLSGYRRAHTGSPFSYHSPLPDTTKALLVRANRAFPRIAWESAPLPTTPRGESIHLVWMFAIDVNEDIQTFTLHINGRPGLSFTNPATATKRTWSVTGPTGAKLTFRATMLDRHGDLMGFASLEIPRAGTQPGKPVKLEVRGADQDRAVWYMTFQRDLEEIGRLEQSPLIIKKDKAGCQRVHLNYIHLGEATQLHYQAPGLTAGKAPLAFGQNRIPLDFTPPQAPQRVELCYRIGTGEEQTLHFTLAPVRRWTLYLVQHTHTDIGYTRPQSEILPEHLRFIDYALDWCDTTDDYPDDAKFRWTCEASWAVREYLRRRPKSQVERLLTRVKEGRIEVTGMFANFSELPDEAAIRASLNPLGELGERGIKVTTAMQNDVNGIAWCLADWFPPLGVNYLIMGQHSHRARACFPRPTPFWWESPAGERILAFRADHYMTGNTWGLDPENLDGFGAACCRHLKDLEKNGYPYERIAVQYSGYVTDNAPPSTTTCELIRKWNETYLWPRLRSATAREFMDHLATEHGDKLPVHRQAWPDWWTDGFGSAARETGLARELHGDLLADQALLALAARRNLPLPGQWEEELQKIYEQLLFYGEHTFGADESVTAPRGENNQVQWGEKAAYIWSARKQEAMLRETALGILAGQSPKGKDPTLLVFNPLGWTRSGLNRVYIDHQIVPPERAFEIRDEQGRPLPVQHLKSRSDGTYWLVWSPHIPALGSRSFTIHSTDKPRRIAKWAESNRLANRHYRIEFDRTKGSITSLKDLALDLELVDGQAPWPFLSLIQESLGNRHQLEQFKLDDFQRHGLTRIALEKGAKGPIWDSIRFSGSLRDGPKGGRVTGEIRLFHPEKRIEFHFRLHNPRCTTPEGIYIAFPFALPDSRIVYEAQGGAVTPGVDQLPGSSADWHTIQSYSAVRNDRSQIILGSKRIPLAHFGEINLGKFQYQAKVNQPHIYSWVMNNYWTTNFQADQEGELRWSYHLTSTADTSNTAATRAGWTAKVPLVSRVIPRGLATTLPTLVQDLPPGLLLVATWPTPNGKGQIFHLRELDGRECQLDPGALSNNTTPKIEEVSPLGREGARLNGTISFKPNQVRFLRLTW